jgi:hypothetical protein
MTKTGKHENEAFGESVIKNRVVRTDLRKSNF